MSEITDAFVKDATTEYLSHRGEQPYRILRGGQQLWETHAPAIRAALACANRLSPAPAPEALQYEELSKLESYEIHLAAAIGTCRFLDPPDGGDVSLIEQVRRMRTALDEAEDQRSAASVEPFDVMATIDPDFAESFERDPYAPTTSPEPDAVRGLVYEVALAELEKKRLMPTSVTLATAIANAYSAALSAQ